MWIRVIIGEVWYDCRMSLTRGIFALAAIAVGILLLTTVVFTLRIRTVARGEHGQLALAQQCEYRTLSDGQASIEAQGDRVLFVGCGGFF